MTLPEIQELFRLYMKALKMPLSTHDILWIVETRHRAEYFSALLHA